MAPETESPTPDEIVEVIADIWRLHRMALRQEDSTEEANALRRHIHRRWRRLDPERRLRIQEAQDDLLRQWLTSLRESPDAPA